ncbi:MAG TPA: DMT family transporter, partial [Paracoccaceae bacterium]|nr:DMT family transporter [Paracoccaceae bacterium]
FPVAWALGRLARPSARDLALHLIRSAFLAASTLFFFAALAHMPVADAIAVFFVEPFILTLLSGLLLGEPVGWRRYLACAIGFAGALLVIQPSFAEIGWPAAYPLATALLFAIYLVLTRSMAPNRDPFDLQAWTALGGTLILALLLALFENTGQPALDPIPPPAFTLPWLLGIGVMATISHLFITAAFRAAPASVLAPLQYLEIVAATLLGLLVFGDFPDSLTWAGVAIIVGSGLFVAWRERLAARMPSVRETAPPPR